MRKLFLITTLMAAIAMGGCKKDKTTPDEEDKKLTTGNWTMTVWDNSSTAATGSLNLKADGNSDFEITWSGSSTAKTENDTYVTASDNTTITFTQTGGDVNYLSGGSPWTITTLDAHNLKIKSQFGLIAEFTR